MMRKGYLRQKNYSGCIESDHFKFTVRYLKEYMNVFNIDFYS